MKKDILTIIAITTVVEPPTQTTMVPELDTMPETSIARESTGDSREHATSTTE